MPPDARGKISGGTMFICPQCDNLRFAEASEAFQHLCIEHENESAEMKLILEAVFDFQFAHYVEIPVAYLE
jgi:hypothetical protein